jgi:CDP-4-dehydro-6-deoxyglucose reductase, E1
MKEYKWPLMKNTLTFFDRLKLAQFIIQSDRFTQGEKVKKFEEQWSEWLGCKHSLFVTSGSTANFLLVASIIEKYGLKRGYKVLLPACTWVTNINPIFQLGLTPIFCDISLSDYSFDIDNLKRISEKHSDIKLIFVSHLLGIPANVDEYKKYFPNAIFIDDVCESHGCTNPDGSKVGSDSLGSTFSFYFGHHMSTIEGGMISTNDSDLYDLMKMKRTHGLARASSKFDEYADKSPEIEKSFLFVTDGYNFRNTELNAVLGIEQLKRLDSFIYIRRKYYKQFVDIHNSKECFYPITFNGGNSSFCLPFLCKTKKIKQKLISLFQKYGIEYRPIVGGNLLKQPYMHGYEISCIDKELNVDILHENGVYIGNNQFICETNMQILTKLILELEESLNE